MGFGFRVPGPESGFEVRYFRFRVSGVGFRVPCFVFRVWVFVGFGFQVPGFAFGV